MIAVINALSKPLPSSSDSSNSKESSGIRQDKFSDTDSKTAVISYEHLKNTISKFAKENDCPICLENLNKSDFTITSCTHVFHSKCIEEWKKQKIKARQLPRCPICIQPLQTPIQTKTPVTPLLTNTDAERETSYSVIDMIVLLNLYRRLFTFFSWIMK